MNKEEIDYSLKILKQIYNLEKKLDDYFFKHLDSEHSFMLRSLVLMEMMIDYLEFDLHKMESEKNEI